jgi:hypothetical protein
VHLPSFLWGCCLRACLSLWLAVLLPAACGCVTCCKCLSPVFCLCLLLLSMQDLCMWHTAGSEDMHDCNTHMPLLRPALLLHPCRALEVLGALVADDPSRLRWLLAAGVLQLLERLVLEREDLQEAGLRAEAAQGFWSGLPADGALVDGVSKLRLAGWGAGSGGSSSSSSSSSSLGGLLKVSQAEAKPSHSLTPLPGADAGRRDSSSVGAGAVPAASSIAEAEHAAGSLEEQLQQDGAVPLDAPLLCVQRQVARLLALLALVPEAAQQLAFSRWHSWLEQAAATGDCRLSSSATRALVHLDTVLAVQQAEEQRWHFPLLDLPVLEKLEKLAGHGQGGHGQGTGGSEQNGAAPLLNSFLGAGSEAAGSGAAHDAGGATSTAALTSSAGSSSNADADLQQLSKRSIGRTSLPVFRDGVHLLNPEAVLRWSSAAIAAATSPGASSGNDLVDLLRFVLSGPSSEHSCNSSVSGSGSGSEAAAPGVPAAAGGADSSSGSRHSQQGFALHQQQQQQQGKGSGPVMDVVFLHGIRGGPFVTWRRPGARSAGGAQRNLDHTSCWPSEWLARDLPGARLLSVEYQAPVSAWEGEQTCRMLHLHAACCTL